MTDASERSRRRTLPGVVCAALAVLAVSAPAVSAAVKPSFVARPVASGRPYFVLGAKPGQVLHRQIQVINNGKVAGPVRVYPVDATTGATSGAVYRDRAFARRDVGAWTRVTPDRTVLRPGQSRVVDVQITVPSDAGSGDHLGGFVVEPAVAKRTAGSKKGASFSVKIHTLTVVALEVQVAGPRSPKLTIDGARAGGLQKQQQVLLNLSNRGNTLFKGQGAMNIYDSRGKLVKKAGFRLNTFVPHTAIAYPVALSGLALAEGHYQAGVTIRYAGDHVVRRMVSFEVTRKSLRHTFGGVTTKPRGEGGFPVWIIGIGLALVLLAAAAWKMSRMRRQRMALLAARERDLAELERLRLSAPVAAVPLSELPPPSPPDGAVH